ncbi:fungal-specific transcription factor domain-containing protein [Talaromyces proteolyticus]|uniref:Fungal-specific transcription factor domain-containing protein n=1 Tax=Talaromyces proteolyticus TaxID=1131652 RepID=A0AAD4Q010_9EURO|nr:fungal-specific transcription factor domain-containing protein [Talaromyces proteolyticus]KAH8703593.1 fungal-specific transcription factor domain-containing protein [Talaromyces proteolyticus]
MPNRRSRGRAAVACLSCRQKKLKCDSIKPKCGNCFAKGVECQQGTVLHKPRPTNSRIAQLELENKALRQRYTQLLDEVSVKGREESESLREGPSFQTPGTVNTPRHQYTNDIPHPEAPIERNRSSVSLYHGATSTAYDETAKSSPQDTENIESIADLDRSRHLLFTQTAKQRQLEPFDLAAGRLDFDDVDPEIGKELLLMYWSRQLYTAQIIYRPAFMRDMACGGPYFSKLLLNAIFFVVSKHNPRPELRSDPEDITTAGWKFRQRFTELLRYSFDRSEITTLQALLIVSNALFSRCDERSTSWLYAGNAFNMIIDLGLHVLPSMNSISAEELEIRKRILWGAYSIDKVQCLYQGRPPILRRVNFNVPLRFLDEYDELEQFQGLTYTATTETPAVPSMNVTLLTKLCEVSIIIERILSEIYPGPGLEAKQIQNVNIFADIKSNLKKWRASLPPEMDYLLHPRSDSVILPQSLCLLALYNVLIILSQRPLITENNGRQRSLTAHESVNSCTTAANQIVQILQDYCERFSIDSAPYMLSYATYISATVHARIVALKGKTSNAFQSLLVCRTILQGHKRLYKAAEVAMDNLDKFMSHLGFNITDDNSVTWSGDLSHQAAGYGPGEDVIALPEWLDPVNPPLDLMNSDLLDLDLEAVTQGFSVDGEFNFLMHPFRA